MRWLSAALVAVVALAGCTSPPPTPSPPVPTGTQGEVPGGVPVMAEHTLAPNDEIEIRFPFATEFNDRVTVGSGWLARRRNCSRRSCSAGSPCRRPLLGWNRLTPARCATRSFRSRYAPHAPQAVYVDGWVIHPGLIRSEVPLTVARAIARAGGVKSGAKTGDILLLRRDTGGRLQSYQVALGDFGGAGGEDPLAQILRRGLRIGQPGSPPSASFVAQYSKNLPFSANYDINRPPIPTTQPLQQQLTAPR